MRLKSILILTAALTGFSSLVLAQEHERELQSGLNYTSFGSQTPKDETKNGPQAPNAPKAPQKTSISKPQKPALATTEDPEEKESAEIRIWNKYKALAAGQAGKTEETNKETLSETGKTKLENATPPSSGESKAVQSAIKSWHAPKTEEEAASEEPKQVSGISAILNEWQSSKSQQKEMRTKHFAVPEGIGTSTKNQNKSP